MELRAQGLSCNRSSSDLRLEELYIDNLVSCGLRAFPGFPVRHKFQVPQLMGSGKCFRNLTIPPHSPVKERGIFNYLDEDSIQNPFRKEL